MLELLIGKNYVVKHSHRQISAQLLAIVPPSKWSNTHYRFLNQETGRVITIRSKGKILRQLGTEPYEYHLA